MTTEELIMHMEHYRNNIVDKLKGLDDIQKDNWIIWLKMELEAELGLRKRGEIREPEHCGCL